jgi:polyisoprenoid-binding protein YceI
MPRDHLFPIRCRLATAAIRAMIPSFAGTRRSIAPAVFALLTSGLPLAPMAGAQQRSIDTAKSTITVHVFKAGALSAFGHNHEIAAPIARGTVDTSAHQVELNVRSEALTVRDADVSDKDRAEIQATMLGPEVLDAQHQPEIVFRSTASQQAGTGSWTVNGNITIRGQTRAVIVPVRELGGAHYAGGVSLKQTDFGIKPVKVAGGAVRVKDEIRIEFDIQLAP